GRHRESEAADLLGEPGQPARVVRRRSLDVICILNGGYARGDRRMVDVEWAADPIERVDDMGRTIEPAQAKGGESVNFRERPAHHHVFRGCYELQSGFVVVASDVFGVGGVKHQEYMPRQGAAQSLD